MWTALAFVFGLTAVADQADQADLCAAVLRGDAAAVRTLVAAGAHPSESCVVGSGARRSSAASAGVATAITVGSGGILAPIGTAVAKSRGGANSVAMADVAIQRRDRALLDALQSKGELEEVQRCVSEGIQGGSWNKARFCAAALEQPIIRHLGEDTANDSLIAFLRDHPPKFDERKNRIFGVVDWGPSWARRPDVIEVLLQLGLSRESLHRTATDAISDGQLAGLDVLHSRYEIPLRPETVNHLWAESPRFRAQLGKLDLDWSGLHVDWDSPSLQKSVVAHPHSVVDWVKIGMPVKSLDGAMAVALQYNSTQLVRNLQSLGASVEVDLPIAALCSDSALRQRVLAVGATLVLPHEPSRAHTTCAAALMTDSELVDFFRTTRAPMCGFVLPLVEQGGLDRLQGLRQGSCTRESVLALIGHPELMAEVDDESMDKHADRLVRGLLETGDSDGLARVLARTTRTLEGRWLEKPMRIAMEDGRADDVASVLARLDDASWPFADHALLLVRHMPAEVAGDLVLSDKARTRLFAAAVQLDRPELLAQLDAPNDPAMVFETLVAAVEAGASPDTVRLTLPHIGQWPNTTALIRPAIARDDFDTLQVLADGERYAATFLWVEAIAAGCPPDVVLALRGAPPSWKWRRRLRIAARDQGWSKEDIQSLLH